MNKTAHSIYIGSFFVVGILSTLLLAINGYQYYTTPLVDRFFNPQNSLLEPSGLLGEGLGVIGSFMMIVGVAVYMVRKRVKAFLHFGYLKNWLELHIFLCTLGPVFVLFHTSFKFGGIVAVSFWSMTAVVLSGVVGRFLYVRIPKTIQGQILSVQELNEIGRTYSKKLAADYHVSDSLIHMIEAASDYTTLKKETLSNSIGFLIKDSIHTRRTLRVFSRELKSAGLSRIEIHKARHIAKSRMIVARRIRLLKVMHRFFRHWHIVHLPLAIVMFVIMFIHIGVVFAFGYRWVF
ncbi:MAG TPA: hypothetical protein PL001_08135 [Candidatus Kryptobacter bacterium]|nr:MAG: hypothetical protein B7Z63_02620 [Ignavibacteriae bacterium 37-53-5]HQT91982.1 hypothetical protein [Candidatus Kryptobacter bacterium]